ncbi:MAG TPA: hypothetical protein VNZ64_27605 [Candidatus Acidoferrum sp.]|jgi:hypothetical protein|nr:hypothetical protein [Candidatus Acidoferrum sp.]
MAISVDNIIPNPTIPPRVAQGGLQVLSGIVECRFRGDVAGTGRDTLTFNVGPVIFTGQSAPPIASCTVSLASFGFDGAGSDALWAVDSAEVTNFVNQDKSSGTADLEVVANLAVRGEAGLILRVNYSLFYTPS